MIPNQCYNFVVGGGTAGCVLGSLLSDRENLNILLIEAGGEFNFLSRIPSTPTAIQRGINDWSFVSTPQKYSSFGLKNKVFLVDMFIINHIYDSKLFYVMGYSNNLYLEAKDWVDPVK